MLEQFHVAAVQTPAFSLDQAPAAARYLLQAIDAACTSAPAPDLLLLPECAYPAYFLAPCQDGNLDAYLKGLGAPSTDDFLTALAERARRHHTTIACGVALPEADGRLVNGLVVFDRKGTLAARAGKLFLWHFDESWFCSGSETVTTRLDGHSAGLFVCCDGRAPEIPRSLAVAGAELFLDSTNWVATGRSAALLPNAQPDYMMKVRALENRAWLVAANKVGTEADSIVFCGKSCIIDPDGTVVAMATTDQPEVIRAAIPVEQGRLQGTGPGRPVAGRLDPLGARRSGEYLRLVAAPDAAADGPVPHPFVAALQVGPDENPDDVARLVRNMTVQRAEVMVFPEAVPTNQDLDRWLALSSSTPALLIVSGDTWDAGARRRCAWLLHQGRILGNSCKGHLETQEQAAGYTAGPAEPPVIATPWGRLGVVLGAEMLVPEVCRGLAVGGADLVVWSHSLPYPWVEDVARARAAENRVFVVAAGPAVPGGESLVVDPAGAVLARTFPGTRQAVAAVCLLAAARVKTIVPGTEALGGPTRAIWTRNLG